ncbi:MAG: hypothetical protein QXM96_01600 [Candidatus Woesearchaeota archaeon]
MNDLTKYIFLHDVLQVFNNGFEVSENSKYVYLHYLIKFFKDDKINMFEKIKTDCIIKLHEINNKHINYLKELEKNGLLFEDKQNKIIVFKNFWKDKVCFSNLVLDSLDYGFVVNKEIIDVFKNNSLYNLCLMRYNIKTNVLNNLFIEFNYYVKAINTRYKNDSDYFKHFYFWINKRIKSNNKIENKTNKILR